MKDLRIPARYKNRKFLLGIPSVLSEMFEEREPFKLIFKIIRIFGFWGEISGTHKFLANVFYFIFVIFYTFMVNLSLLQIKEMNELLQYITIMPLLIIIIVSVRNFVRKMDQAKTMLGLLTEMDNSSSKSYFNEICAFLNNFSKLMMVSGIIFNLVFTFSAIFLNKLNFPMFIPGSWANKRSTFYIYWIFEVSYWIFRWYF